MIGLLLLLLLAYYSYDENTVGNNNNQIKEQIESVKNHITECGDKVQENIAKSYSEQARKQSLSVNVSTKQTYANVLSGKTLIVKPK